MMGLLNMKMLLSVGILYVLLDNGLGAPAQGRYMWVKCNPNGLDANCVKQKGPLVDLSGLPDRLSASALKDLMKKNSEPMEGPEEKSVEEKPVEEKEEAQYEVYDEVPDEVQAEEKPEALPVMTEYSGEGPFPGDQGSGEQVVDYSSYVHAKKVMIDQVIPPAQEMEEDHLLL